MNQRCCSSGFGTIDAASFLHSCQLNFKLTLGGPLWVGHNFYLLIGPGHELTLGSRIGRAQDSGRQYCLQLSTA